MHAPAPLPDAIAAPQLATLPGIRHAFFTRRGGVSKGIYASLNIGIGSADDRASVLENRARAAAHLGLGPERLATPYQIHSAEAAVVAEPWPVGQGPKLDALATNRPGIAIGVGTADCAPLLLADSQARVVGAAHAGWKGALTGVLEAAVEAMERLGAHRERIVAVIGPTISQAAYEVGPEFVSRFGSDDSANARFFEPSARLGHALFDLPGYILARLEVFGVGHAADLGLCTYRHEDRFFSYRRATHRGEPDYGRLLAAIALAEE
jgi:polyphenol oxidase